MFRQFIITFTAVLAAGIIVFVVFDRRQAALAEQAQELARWTKQAKTMTTEIRSILVERNPDKQTKAMLDNCCTVGSYLLGECPRGADASELKDAIEDAKSAKGKWGGAGARSDSN